MKISRLFVVSAAVCGALTAAAEIKVGIVGVDTSHTIAFTDMLNVKRETPLQREFRVTDAYQWGSRDIFSSTNRYPQYLEKMAAMGVRLAPTLAELLSRVDVVLLETNDGERHYEQAVEIFKSGKPVFIDKPIAHNFRDAARICAAAKEMKAPFFSCSSLRFLAEIENVRAGKYGAVIGADTVSPCNFEPKHLGMAWYGVHAIDPLFAMMGRGVESVTAVRTEKTMLVTCVWKDGRVGVARAMPSKPHYGGFVFCEKQRLDIGEYAGYGGLLERILEFFKDPEHKPVVDPDETLEIFAVMEAADESVRRGGAKVTLAEIMGK